MGLFATSKSVKDPVEDVQDLAERGVYNNVLGINLGNFCKSYVVDSWRSIRVATPYSGWSADSKLQERNDKQDKKT